MATLLTYISTPNGAIKRSSLEVLSQVASLASRDGHECAALVAGSNARGSASELARFGANSVYVATDPVFEDLDSEPLVELLAKVIADTNPPIVAFASTEAVKDIIGALAIKTGAAAIPDVSTFDLSGNTVTALRPVMAAKTLARTVSQKELTLVSVRSGSYDAVEQEGAGNVIEVDIKPEKSPVKTIREVLTAATGSVDLNEARVVVSAGRGVRDEEGLSLVNELSSLLGAATGATRAVVESGMFPATTQIGQTGKVVSPELYFAIGISGAIQHVAGMSNSKVIVAINKDPDAPIFKYATYGIVGDLYKVLPPLIAELRSVVESA